MPRQPKAKSGTGPLQDQLEDPCVSVSEVPVGGNRTALGTGSEPEMEVLSCLEASDVEGGCRKRPSSSLSVSGYLGSDMETEETVAAKVNKPRRGRGRTAKAAPSRGEFLKPPLVPSDGELDRVLRNRQFKKGLADAASTGFPSESGDDSDAVAIVGDLSTLNAQELRAQAGEKLACILEVARKSGNLKGEFVGRLKRSASVIREVVEALSSRSEAEETRRLRADNGRLRLEVESCKAEIKALRRGFADAKKEAADANTAAATANIEAHIPPTILGAELVEELRQSLTVTLGEMLSARLAVIEDRLLPAPMIRPPLRADARKVVANVEQLEGVPELTQVSVPKAGRRAGQAPRIAAVPMMAPLAGTSTRRDTPHSGEAVPSSGSRTESWVTVVRKKGKGKKNGEPAAPGAIASNATMPRSEAVRTSKPAKVSLRSPKSAAIVLSLQPEAVKRGISFGDALQMAQDRVDLTELGIEQLRFRQTATGARMLEISGSENSEKADKLAEKLRGALSEVASIARPIKSADLNITGLDDAATKDKVAAAVAKAGCCNVQLVKAGEIYRSVNGTGSALVSCPVSAAKVLLEKGRLLVGWSSVRVVAMAARPLRCYRCMGLGHTRPQCPASVDRGDLCFRCGDIGHKRASCGKTDLRCAICADSGRPSGHVMGGRNCIPPKMKGKPIGIQVAVGFPAATNSTPREASQEASEEAVMSE